MDTSLSDSDNSISERTELYFIDHRVQDIDIITVHLPKNAMLIELEGIEKITETIEQYKNINAVHIISQGN